MGSAIPKKAQDLGNTRPGDGFRFRGGGLMQTTGGDAYRRMGEKAHANFYDEPDLIVDPQYAVKPALYEWQEGHLNTYADKNDIRTITRIINGGYYGLKDRQDLFNQIWKIVNGSGSAPDAWREAQTDEDVRWLQEALNTLGADPQLLVDGRYGPATTTAVRWFQQIASLQVDGIAGEVTKAAIKLRLDRKH